MLKFKKKLTSNKVKQYENDKKPVTNEAALVSFCATKIVNQHGSVVPFQLTGVKNCKPSKTILSKKSCSSSELSFPVSNMSPSNHNLTATKHNNGNGKELIGKPSLWQGIKSDKDKLHLKQQQRNRYAHNTALAYGNMKPFQHNAWHRADANNSNDKGLLNKIKSFVREFLLESSIHGFVYLAKIGLNFIER